MGIFSWFDSMCSTYFMRSCNCYLYSPEFSTVRCTAIFGKRYFSCSLYSSFYVCVFKAEKTSCCSTIFTRAISSAAIKSLVHHLQSRKISSTFVCFCYQLQQSDILKSFAGLNFEISVLLFLYCFSFFIVSISISIFFLFVRNLSWIKVKGRQCEKWWMVIRNSSCTTRRN